MEDTLARDLVAMWQSEMTAMAADREVRESWAAFLALWAQTANFVLSFGRHDVAAGGAGAAQPAGTAAAAAASQPGMGEVEQLSRRVAELEQILARFVDGGGKPSGPGGSQPEPPGPGEPA